MGTLRGNNVTGKQKVMAHCATGSGGCTQFALTLSPNWPFTKSHRYNAIFLSNNLSATEKKKFVKKNLSDCVWESLAKTMFLSSFFFE